MHCRGLLHALMCSDAGAVVGCWLDMCLHGLLTTFTQVEVQERVVLITAEFYDTGVWLLNLEKFMGLGT